MKKPKLTREEKREKKRLEKRENEHKIGINQFIKVGVFLLLSLAIEIATYVMVGIKNPYSGNLQLLPTYIFFDVGVWLIISGFMLTCSAKWFQNTIFYFTISFQAILLLANVTLHDGYGYFFTWDMLALVGEAIKSFDASFVSIGLLAGGFGVIILLVSIPLIIDKCLSKKKIVLNRISKPTFYLIAFFTCFLLGVSSFGIQTNTLASAKDETYAEITSDKYLYDNMHIKEEAFRKFGTCGFYLKNLYDLTLAKLDNSDQDEITQKINDGKVAENQDATLYGDNLIVIMLESYEWFAIDPYNTPNLWKLKTGETTSDTTTVPSAGIAMTGFTANNKTNVSETISLLGYMPSINKATFKENSLAAAYSLPNLFKKQGYTVNYFHNWEREFYDRDVNNINMGFDNFYSLEDYEAPDKSTEFNNFNKEADYVAYLIDKIAPTDQKFMSFYTTVSTHGSYEVVNDHFAEYYEIYDANQSNLKTWMQSTGYVYPQDEYGEQILREYKCAAMDSDAMLGVLFEHLTQNNMLDNTTILLYADHNAYYHNLSQLIKGTAIEDEGNLLTHNIPLLIYSQKLGSRTISDFCNTYDIYPTICEEFGLEYSTAFTQGVNMLTEDIKDSIFPSYLTGIYNGKGWTKNAVNFTKYEGSTDEDIAYFKQLICEYYQKQSDLEKIYSRGWTA